METPPDVDRTIENEQYLRADNCSVNSVKQIHKFSSAVDRTSLYITHKPPEDWASLNPLTAENPKTERASI